MNMKANIFPDTSAKDCFYWRNTDKDLQFRWVPLLPHTINMRELVGAFKNKGTICFLDTSIFGRTDSVFYTALEKLDSGELDEENNSLNEEYGRLKYLFEIKDQCMTVPTVRSEINEGCEDHFQQTYKALVKKVSFSDKLSKELKNIRKIRAGLERSLEVPNLPGHSYYRDNFTNSKGFFENYKIWNPESIVRFKDRAIDMYVGTSIISDEMSKEDKKKNVVLFSSNSGFVRQGPIFHNLLDNDNKTYLKPPLVAFLVQDFEANSSSYQLCRMEVRKR